MQHDELWRLDATAQAALVRAGSVHPRELVAAALDRIARLNPQINAVIASLADRAAAAAEAPAGDDALFAGVPMLIKDASLHVEGTPYSLGVGALRDAGYRSTRTTELARRFERAGFIFLGKTNVPEMSSGITTEPTAFGPARNPWALDRSTSGSSGGSAAAVAAGMTSIAHGADATGSLRYPAAACGVVTLKPTRGLVPSSTPTGEADDLDVWSEFVLTRSVRDIAGVLDAVGDTRGDASYAATLMEPQPALRIGVVTRDVLAGIPVDGECADAVVRTGTLLAALGHVVEETHPSALEGSAIRIGRAIVMLGPGMRAEQLAWIEERIGRPLRSGDVADEYLVARDAPVSTPSEVAEAHRLIRSEIDPLLAWWRDGWDILVTPTLRQPAWPLGRSGGALDAGVFPVPFSITGQPAMSLPLFTSREGLPIGIQIIGAPGRDGLLLRLAAQLEQAARWRDRWPAIATSS